MTAKEKKNQIYIATQEQKKDKALLQIQEYLEKHFASYVLVTCSKPSVQGQMQAELSHYGEVALVNYLVDSACRILLDEENTVKDRC